MSARMEKVREALGLHKSMALSNELPTKSSAAALAAALAEVEEWEAGHVDLGQLVLEQGRLKKELSSLQAELALTQKDLAEAEAASDDKLVEAYDALAALVRLKDGPRSGSYEKAKYAAWARARTALVAEKSS